MNLTDIPDIIVLIVNQFKNEPKEFHRFIQVNKIIHNKFLDNYQFVLSTFKTAVITSSGTYKTLYGNLKHSFDDDYAWEKSGTKVWYYYGKIHRLTTDEYGLVLPARINSNGGQEWYIDGFRHRGCDLPAIICGNGTKEWYIYDRKHRTKQDINGRTLPAYIGSDGTKKWFCLGVLHNPDIDNRGKLLPAIITANNRQECALHGKFLGVYYNHY